MTSSITLSVTTFIYGLDCALYISFWIFKKDAVGKTSTWVLLLAAVGNALGIILRWKESYKLGFGHAPFSNMYESLIFFSLSIAVIYLVIENRYKNKGIGVFASPLAFLAIAYASLGSDRIQPLVPALKSNWLIAHVVTCFLGYAAFAIAFGMSLMFLIAMLTGLIKGKNEGGSTGFLPSQNVLDELTYKMIMFGFFFLSIGIITGAVWANSAWGRYWGWDPKETWSLITWFVYAICLHVRLMQGWRGTRMALLSIVGFLAVLFTYFGVNYLPGLHSYGQT